MGQLKRNDALWKHFAPTVERRKILCRQKLESAGLPLQLFTISERPRDFGLAFFGSCDSCSVHDLLEWHIFSPIHRRTGTDVRNLFLGSFRATNATPFGAGYSGFYDFVLALEIDLPKQDLEALQIDKREWDICPELEDAVIFYLKHLVSLLDPSEDIHKPQETMVAFDGLKRKLGEHWRALTAAYLLSGPSRLVWCFCPISDDIIAALDVISNRFFPPHVISSIEDAAFPFDFPYPQSKRDMFHSLTSGCGLPRWLKCPWSSHYLGVSHDDILSELCYLHDYKRLYSSREHSGGGMGDNDSNTTHMDGDWHDNHKLMMSTPASVLASQTMLETDYNNWALVQRVRNFIKDYKKVEEKHMEMTRVKNSNNCSNMDGAQFNL
ncbi:hypothetical protein BJ165DRAFT_235028 [Panaeolus papilionaceus]|nr:hypothetical protein BJ165DRAFT_235028 [Panaeolus papilionaceus]